MALNDQFHEQRVALRRHVSAESETGTCVDRVSAIIRPEPGIDRNSRSEHESRKNFSTQGGVRHHIVPGEAVRVVGETVLALIVVDLGLQERGAQSDIEPLELSQSGGIAEKRRRHFLQSDVGSARTPAIGFRLKFSRYRY